MFSTYSESGPSSTRRGRSPAVPRVLALAALALLVPAPSFGHGWLVPTKPNVPPLAIKNQRVEVRIRNQVATTRIRQVFVNHTGQRLEATYVFPLPAAATITDFSMVVNGELMRGELVEKGRARQIYQDIVRKMRDPGLLEYIGSNLFRVSVFPIEPHSEQRIELTYSERIPYDAGICHYVFPLRTGEKASRVLEDHTFKVTIESAVPLKSVYSPTHAIDVHKDGDHKAVVGFEEMGAALDRDFELFYTVSKKDLGVSLLTHRAAGADGYFMLMLTPKEKYKADEIVARDVTFVLDTSGSMRADGKIEQAKKALKFCVSSLNARDRFNIVRFSTEAELFRESPVEASKENVQKALAFIDGFEARGGTAIHEALLSALGQKRDGERPHLVVFLTDGLPTIGEQDVDRILKDVTTARGKTRIFCFGVGYDVNTRLLDTLSGAARGATEYVKPEEDIEVKVSLFQNKIGYPVLADLNLDLGKIRVKDVFPRELPDLFRGGQLVVLGRYSEGGESAATLSGTVNGAKRTIVEDVTFPAEEKGNEFIPRLWAQKQVAFLVGQLRTHGENRELIDEVISLSKEFGIMTPYTSYLVLEDEGAYKHHGLRPQQQAGGGWGRGNRFARSPAASSTSGTRSDLRLRGDKDVVEKALSEALRGPMERERSAARSAARPAADASAGAKPALRLELARKRKKDEADALKVFSASRARRALQAWARSGRSKEEGRRAVRFSTELKRLSSKTDAAARSKAIRTVGRRTFYRVYGVWVESSFGAGSKVVKVKPFSDAYFELIELRPELARVLALGEYVIARSGKVYIQTDDDGIADARALVRALR